MKVAIVDYGMGNIGSICNMLKYIDVSYVVSREAAEIAACDKLILPGVGHFDLAMDNLRAFGLDEVIGEFAQVKKKPVLGICLGMQLLCNGSEEGNRRGLSFVDADVVKFEANDFPAIKIPHMGWSEVDFVKSGPMSEGLEGETRFYFVHSYYVHCNNEDDIWGVSEYGVPYIAAFIRDNVVGVQFHPEKSHKFGIQLFRNFFSKFHS